MNPPNASLMPRSPTEGESLEVSGIENWTDDKKTIAVLKGLAEAKAPQSVAQMVIWYAISGANWDDVGRLSQGWGNASEIALARQFVGNLRTGAKPSSDASKPSKLKEETGVLYWELKGDDAKQQELVDGVRELWKKYPVLGLATREGVPVEPGAPALACRAEISDTAISIKLSASHPAGTDWILIDRFQVKRSTVKPAGDAGTKEQAPSLERRSAQLALALTQALAERLVRVKLAHGPRVHGKETFKIKIINDSPLILNGMAVDGKNSANDHAPALLLGLSLPPLKTLTVPATADAVKRLGLKEGARVVATDLSGL